MIRYVAKAPFVSALAVWERRQAGDFPLNVPPTGEIIGAAPENAALAELFQRLCALQTPTDRLLALMGAIERMRRHVKLFEDSLRGERNPRAVGTMDRSGWASIKPMETMISVMEQWRDELHAAWMNDIGAGFIEQAAKTRVMA